jgi:hypothetical protein
MTPRDELKGMLEHIAERALDNVDEYGFHLPVCFGHSPMGEPVYIVAEPSEDAEVDLQACKQSVLHQTRLWISQGKLRAIAFATVINITIANDDGGTSQTDAVKILLDHIEKPGYAAFVTFQKTDGKAMPGRIIYQELPERFFD